MLILALPFKVLVWIFSPLASLVAGATGRLSRWLGAEASPEGPVVTPAELKVMVAASEEEGLIEEEERTMIDNILELEQISVREVMVPRPDIVALTNTATIREASDIFIKEGYSRLPIYHESIDDIVGVLYGKDLLPLLLDGKLTDPVGNFVRPVYFVPESKKTADLLQELQQKRVHIAIIVDEYGGTAGLVTIEDLLEEIVGEIVDEYDREEPNFEASGNGGYRVNARLPVAELNELLDVELPDTEWDTVGGLMMALLGRLPQPGEHADLGSLRFTAEEMKGRRIRKVLVERLQPASTDAAEE